MSSIGKTAVDVDCWTLYDLCTVMKYNIWKVERNMQTKLNIYGFRIIEITVQKCQYVFGFYFAESNFQYDLKLFCWMGIKIMSGSMKARILFT